MFDELYDKLKDEKSVLMDLLIATVGLTLFKKLTVNQVIWGYDDPIIHMINTLPDFWPIRLRSRVIAFLREKGIEIPKFSRIAIFVSTRVLQK